MQPNDLYSCLSDPSLIIGYPYHSLTHSLRLVNLIDVTLACEDGNSKLVEVVTVVDVDDEKRVGNSLLQIWKLKLKKVNFVQSLSTSFEASWQWTRHGSRAEGRR